MSDARAPVDAALTAPHGACRGAAACGVGLGDALGTHGRVHDVCTYYFVCSECWCGARAVLGVCASLRCAADTLGQDARVGKRCIGSTAECDQDTRVKTYTLLVTKRTMPVRLVHSWFVFHETAASARTARLLRLSRTCAVCVCDGRGRRLRLLELSFRRWRAALQGVGDVELLPVRHGGKEGLTHLHRRRSSLHSLRRCRRGLRGEDGAGSFRSPTLGGVLERRDMIDQELEVDVDAG